MAKCWAAGRGCKKFEVGFIFPGVLPHIIMSEPWASVVEATGIILAVLDITATVPASPAYYITTIL